MNFTRVTKRHLVLIHTFFSFAANAEPTPPANTSPLPDLPLATINSDSQTVKGRDGWYFLSTEIEHLLTAKEQIPQVVDSQTIAEIRNYAAALKTLGIRLVLMPIPEKALIRMDGLLEASALPDAKGYSRATQAYLDALKKNEVDFIDLYDQFKPYKDPTYCKTDSHFTPRTAARISACIIKHIAEKFPEVPIQNSSADPETQASISQITIKGDLAGNETEESIELLTAPQTSASINQPGAITNSPMLLMGDSHLLVFNQGGDMHASGGGIVDHLTAALGYSPDVISTKGDGINAVRIKIYRDLKKNPDILKDKKIIIWCFAARSFSQQEWKSVKLR